MTKLMKIKEPVKSKKKSGAGGSLLENRFMFSGNAFPQGFRVFFVMSRFL